MNKSTRGRLALLGIVIVFAIPLAAAFLVRRSIEAAATEVFVHRTTDPAPERVLEALVDMICRYLFVEEARAQSD